MQENPTLIHIEWTADEPEYASFQEAIAGPAKGVRAKRAAEDSRALQGREIRSGEYTNQSLWLFLSDETVLHIWLDSLDAGVVKWIITSDPRRLLRHHESIQARLLLQFPNAGPPHLWDREETLRRLVSKRIKYISTSHAWAFLGLEGGSEFELSRLKVRDTGEDLLSFGES
jgi:hypothetical protein